MNKQEKELHLAICESMSKFAKEVIAIEYKKLGLDEKYFDNSGVVAEKNNTMIFGDCIDIFKKHSDESALAYFITDDTEINKTAGNQGDKTFENWLKANKKNLP